MSQAPSNLLNRRRFLAATTAGVPILGAQRQAHSAVRVHTAVATQAHPSGTRSVTRPNVVLLLADDMGYQDPDCFGGTFVRTPHLDALAASGTRLTNFYAASAVCTPSRAAILSGRYPLRYDIRAHFPDDESHLPPTAQTIAKRLRSAGYKTGHVGKWHLGGLHIEHAQNRAASIPGPNQHGFDDYLCQIEQLEPRARMGRERILFRQGGTCLLRNDQRVGPADPLYPKHLTELIGDESTRLIERYHAEGKPFFLNVWFLAPHTPYEPAPDPHWSRYRDEPVSEDQRRFRSMVSCLDAQVGRVIGKLEELGIRENTLILFTSDNGGAWEANNGSFKGGKTDLHEAGIRVPAIASWPGQLPAGRTLTGFGHHTDLLPTILAATGLSSGNPSLLDGHNLLPVLRGESPGDSDRSVFWQMDLYRNLQRHYPKPEPYITEVVRRGHWKLNARDGVAQELFDLATDPMETTNLLKQQTTLATAMVEDLRAFLAADRDRSGLPPGN
jgi:arylsulfatase A